MGMETTAFFALIELAMPQGYLLCNEGGSIQWDGRRMRPMTTSLGAAWCNLISHMDASSSSRHL
jgi:hypothetical protein